MTDMNNASGGLGLNPEPFERSEFLRLAGEAFAGCDADFRRVLDVLPVGVYVTDATGVITYYNEAAAALWGHRPQPGSSWCGSWKLHWPDGRPLPYDQSPMSQALRDGQPASGIEAVAERPDGSMVPFRAFATPFHDATGKLLGAVNMLVEAAESNQIQRLLKTHSRCFEALNRIARLLSSEPDLERVIQSVTDHATELSGAKFGAFFYNIADEQGEKLQLFTFSGAPGEAFANFGLPRDTAVFEPTFRGAAVVRSDDVRADPRYGQDAPHCGMAQGRLPVVSYLAVPVVLRSGAVHGGLLLAHDQPGIFTQESEEIVTAIAAHAAIALDNARLLQIAETESVLRRRAGDYERRLAAIVESSDDAIISKDLNGIINSWNSGAVRLFGYMAGEVIGKPITILIPSDRQNEERDILGRISRGEHVDHYETVRRRKDGSLVEISLTVSPVRNAEGVIVGASKVARDITERRRAQQQQVLFVNEIKHRIKNTLAIVQAIAAQTMRSASAGEREAFFARLQALGSAQDLLTSENWHRASLTAVIAKSLAPFQEKHRERIVVEGPDGIWLDAQKSSLLTMALHELATNAAKYGALSNASGRVRLVWERATGQPERLRLRWQETGGPLVKPPERRGFGSILIERALQMDFGRAEMDFDPLGLVCTLEMSL